MASDELRELLAEVLVGGPPPEGTGRGRRLRRLRRDLWVRRFLLEGRLNWRWLEVKHRLGLHTYGELVALDHDLDCTQYRGWRCIVCDEPMPF